MSTQKNSKISVVKEHRHGVYVWLTDDNKIVMNEDGDYLSIEAEENNLIAMTAISKAAKYWGVEGGKPFFLPGRRKIDNDEFEEQKARLAAGLTPDPYDMGALKDDIRAKRNNS